MAPERFRIPDVCVTLQDPATDVFGVPPLMCIEILSGDDRMTDVQEKIDDYLNFGVAHVWLVDPRRHRIYSCNRAGIHDRARLEAGDVSLETSEIFASLIPPSRT